ncbi:MAG: SlyX family protein [Gammaproteobacteria bacterium]|nr:SlyX family protein [Gammaproteobacteria bacterium]NND53941.1 SlyX family protein [Gammaproteobacteria bacterium]
MTDERLTEIEIKLAHTEQAINEMSDVLYAQQALLDKLGAGLAGLRQRVSGMESGSEGTSDDEKPPHY